MQTQSIKLQVQSVQTRTMTTQSTSKSNADSFDNIINNHKNDISTNKQKTSKTGKTSKAEDNKDVRMSRNYCDKIKDNGMDKDSFSDEDVRIIEERAEEIISVEFELTIEETQDILDIMGLSALDLLILITPNGMQSPADNTNIRDFIMELHGVMDESSFLTSDIMNDERNGLISKMTSMLSGEFGVDEEHLQANGDLFESFMDKFEAMIGELDNSEGDSVESDSLVSTISSGSAEEIPVTVEMSDSEMSDSGEESEGVTGNATDDGVNVLDENNSGVAAFTEKLASSLENVNGEENISQTQATMNRIVEQVVRQVRIRVLPQTRSIELQLNPETLGRVNLSVIHANGVMKATLTVQNQVAKEALESQMAVLKENLESHGLKVESVEVNVSEFGFKKEGNEFAGQNQRQNQNGNSPNRAKRARIRNIMSGLQTGVDAYLEEPAEDTDSDSSLDYTV